MEDQSSIDGDRAPATSARRARRRRVGIGTLSALVLGAAVAMLWPGGGAPGPEGAHAFPSLATVLRAATEAPQVQGAEPEERDAAPTLHGAAPTFAAPATGKLKGKSGKSGKPSKSGKSGKPGKPTKPGKATKPTKPGKATKPPVKATASSRAGDLNRQGAAGHAALAVAREFAQAFVVYETGGEKETFKAGFDATATAQLTKALMQRPPRQPADGKVPKAKVVNVVAGPSKGKARTASVSLLRVGVTSELRLEVEQDVGKKWQVTNVLV